MMKKNSEKSLLTRNRCLGKGKDEKIPGMLGTTPRGSVPARILKFYSAPGKEGKRDKSVSAALSPKEKDRGVRRSRTETYQGGTPGRGSR